MQQNVNVALTSQKIMIPLIIADTYYADDSTVDYIGHRPAWGALVDTEITNHTTLDGTNNYGYLHTSATPQLSKDYTTWETGALSDFNYRHVANLDLYYYL